ncbi:MAG: hypothetical protein IPP20_19605 [Gemmatimonadetes bacterium]|nr:hypothetical protein [Gemmatimonadota bacterium]
MRQQYTLDIAFLVLVIAVSLVGFSSLLRGDEASLTGYHVLHIVTSLAWLILLLGQLVLVQQRRYDRHRFVGASILAVGPILIASLTLLTVHSAGREAAAGTVDDLVVQNVMFTLQVALLVFLAFALRRNRKVHGALLMSTALMFLVIALFFTLISYVPGYRIEGPETFDRFAKSGQTSALIGAVIGVSFFLRSWRSGWPWLLVAAFFFGNGFLQFAVAESGRTQAWTNTVGAAGELPAFVCGLAAFSALLWGAWKVAPMHPKDSNERGAV